MVVVPTKDDVKIVVDLTKLNESVRRERHAMPSVEYTLGQLSDARIFSKLHANSGFLASSVGKRICLTDNLHHPLWKILFQAIALRHLISAGTLPEKDVRDPGGKSAVRDYLVVLNIDRACAPAPQ